MKIINLSSIANPISISVQNPSRSDYDRFIGLEHYDSGEPVITRFQGTELLTTSAKAFKANDILIARRNVYLKRAGIVFFDGITSGDSIILRLKEDTQKTIGYSREDLIRYIPFMLNSEHFWIYANKHADGMNSKRISKDTLLEYEFELPSIDEMRDISDKLWAAYRLKEAYKKLLVTTDEMVKSQFIEMFGNPLSLNQKNELKRLGECCILNPRRPNIALCDTDKVSFIPMPAVSEDGYLVDMTDEEYGKVKKGFTYFENNDVLFAKITPCMENGKGAIVHGLTNGIGMGSTEFHVLRPINGISSPYWLLTLTRMPIFRERAAKNMSGTGGQKRVSASYLDHFMVGLPAIEEQRRFEAIYKQADKSKFDDFKSQFIELFENVESYCKLEDLISDTFPGEWGSEPISENAIKVIRTTNFTNEGYLDLTDVVTRDIEPKKVVRKKLKQGDTILERSGGTKDNPVGRVVFFDEIGDYLPNNFTQVLRPKESVNPVYLFYALYNSYNLNKAAMRAMASQTTGIQNLSMSDFMAKSIVLPSRDEQNKFEQIYRQADKSKSVIQKALVYLNDIQSDELGKIA